MVKKIHFIWLSRENKPIPTQCVKFLAEWKDMYKDWEIKVWRNEDLNLFDDKLIKEAWQDKEYPEAQVSNRLRLLLVYLYGGLYADIDTKPIRSVEKLFENCDKLAVGLTQSRTSDAKYIADLNLFYSPKGNPLLELLLLKFTSLKLGNAPINLFVANECKGLVELFPPEYFQGFHITNNTYTLHWPFRMATWVRAQKRK